MRLGDIGNILKTENAIKCQGYVISIIDLILANLAVLITFTQMYSLVLKNGSVRESMMLEMLQLPIQFIFPTHFINNFLIGFTLLTFVIEACLFILLIEGTRKLDGRRLKIWYTTRFVFFILTFVSLVIRTINSRHIPNPYIILEQGAIGIIYMIYRGCGLLVVTLLEELKYKTLLGTTYRLV